MSSSKDGNSAPTSPSPCPRLSQQIRLPAARKGSGSLKHWPGVQGDVHGKPVAA